MVEGFDSEALSSAYSGVPVGAGNDQVQEAPAPAPVAPVVPRIYSEANTKDQDWSGKEDTGRHPDDGDNGHIAVP